MSSGKSEGAIEQYHWIGLGAIMAASTSVVLKGFSGEFARLDHAYAQDVAQLLAGLVPIAAVIGAFLMAFAVGLAMHGVMSDAT